MLDRQTVIEQNTASRNRLQKLIASLSDADFAKVNEDGWTVGTLLAHIAFWDRRLLVLLERREKGDMNPSVLEAEIVNAASAPLWSAIPARTAAALALASAEAVDQKIETLAPAIVEMDVQDIPPIRLVRAKHRGDHIDQIEGMLNR